MKKFFELSASIHSNEYHFPQFSINSLTFNNNKNSDNFPQYPIHHNETAFQRRIYIHHHLCHHHNHPYHLYQVTKKWIFLNKKSSVEDGKNVLQFKRNVLCVETHHNPNFFFVIFYFLLLLLFCTLIHFQSCLINNTICNEKLFSPSASFFFLSQERSVHI